MGKGWGDGEMGKGWWGKIIIFFFELLDPDNLQGKWLQDCMCKGKWVIKWVSMGDGGNGEMGEGVMGENCNNFFQTPWPRKPIRKVTRRLHVQR